VILFDLQQGKQNNDVSHGLSRPLAFVDSGLHLGCTEAKERDAQMMQRFVVVLTNATAIVLSFVAIAILFALSNALTGQAQETPEGHSAAWMGKKLTARSSAREARL
jgi:hypothetical protein